MAPAFVHVLIPATGRVELVHSATAEARGWQVVDPDAVEVEPPSDPGQTSEPVAPQQDSATE